VTTSLYPHAQYRPLGPQIQPRMTRYDIVCLHTMVGSLSGTDSYFRQSGYGGSESHFGVGGNGTAYQWQDCRYTADANYRGSYRIISIETADIGPEFPKWNTNDGRAVPAWTTQQVDAIAAIIAWCHKTYRIPLELIPDSKNTRKGVGYHRQGVQGYMVGGGEQWSTARGKVCPGDRRIAQIPTVISRAKQLISGKHIPTPTPNGRRLLFLTSPMMVGDDVRAIQEWAIPRFSYAADSLVEDGIFGAFMDKFVKEFQKRLDLTVDGVVGPATYSAMAQHGFR
jgi:peptidoglycan hydrolase-like protein with peptidoglycan-binding domain